MSVKLPKKALVTGGAGFLGSHLCERLLNDGYEVTCLDNLFTGSLRNIEKLLHPSSTSTSNPNLSISPSTPLHGQSSPCSPCSPKCAEEACFEGNIAAGDPKGAQACALTFVQHDITQPYRGQYDEIYNLACPASPIHYQRNPLETLWTSIDGMRNVLDLARDTGARVLHASTSEIYGDPMVHPQVESYWGNVNTIGIRSCYDEGKRVAETMAAEYRRCHGVDVRMVRIFNTYGPRMHPQDGRVISNFIMQALNNEDITIYGDGSQTRSFQYCDDLIEAMRRFMSKPKAEIDAFFPLDFCGNHQVGVCTNRSPSLESKSKGSSASTLTPNSSFQKSNPTTIPNSSFVIPHSPHVPVLNTGNPGEYTIKELAEKTIELVNAANLQLHLPPTSSRIIYEPLPGDDPKKRKPDITLAKSFLNWEPKIPLSEGLTKTIAYFRSAFSGK